MCAGGVVVWGVGVHGFSPAEPPAVTPVQVVAATPPASSAYLCAVRCPGYVEPDDSYHDKPSYVAPVVPTTGVVTVYVPAPGVQVSQPSVKASKAASQPKQAKASQPKASSSKASGGGNKAPAAPKAAKQSQPSTTTTTSKGTTSTAHTTTTTQKG